MITIKIGNRYSKAKGNIAAVSTSLLGYICKTVSVISHKSVTTGGGQLPHFSIQFNFSRVPETIIQDITIKITIQVIIKKCSMSGVTFIVKIVFFCFFGKSQVAIINE